MHAAQIAPLSLLAAAAEPTSLQAQLMLVCGFVVLIWVLMRRTIRSKRRSAARQREQTQAVKGHGSAAVPLADAPPEVLRWQAAMFDLQRELKADLETKISVLQAMVQLADQRIATLQRLEQERAESPPHPR